MASSSKEYLALVVDLSEPKAAKVVPAKELFELTPLDEAKQLRPKHDQHFKAKEEYGRLRCIDGRQMMVRYKILALNTELTALQALFGSLKERLVLPPRKSLSPVLEPVAKYTFTKKTARAPKTPPLSSKQKARQGNKVLKEYQRIKDKQASKKKEHEVPSAGVVDIPFAPVRTSSIKEESALNGETTTDEELLHGKDKKADSFNDLLEDAAFKSVEADGNVNIGEETKPDTAETVAKQRNESNANVMGPDKINVKFVDQETQTEGAILPQDNPILLNILNLATTIVKNQEKDVKKDSVLASMNSKLSDISSGQKDIVKLLEGNADLQPKKKTSSIASLANNLVENDEDDNIPEGKIKVGPKRFIDRSQLPAIEKHKFITGRIDSLLELFYGTELPNYSLSGSKRDGSKCNRVQQEEVASLITILQHMKWTYKVVIGESEIRSRISRCASAAYKKPPGEEDAKAAENSGKKKKTHKTSEEVEKKSKKSIKKKGTDDDSDKDDRLSPKKLKKGEKSGEKTGTDDDSDKDHRLSPKKLKKGEKSVEKKGTVDDSDKDDRPSPKKLKKSEKSVEKKGTVGDSDKVDWCSPKKSKSKQKHTQSPKKKFALNEEFTADGDKQHNYYVIEEADFSDMSSTSSNGILNNNTSIKMEL